MKILESDRLLLRPVELGDEALFAEAAGSLDTFRYYVSAVPTALTPQGFEQYVKFLIESPTVDPYAVIHKESGQLIGSSCFMDIRPADFHLEIGMTWYAPEWRGTFVNPECKLLLLTEAFEARGCAKVTLKGDNRNEHSKAAMLKLGCKYEGTLRKHRFTDFGEFRDTAYFGILSEEWPSVKQNLVARLEKLT